MSGLLKSPRRPPAPPRVTPGTRLYAFGDVHGRADLLARLLDGIRSELSAPEQSWDMCQIVGLGDYLDRGPDSRQVLDMLLTPDLPSGCQLVALRGNHEEAFLKVVASADAMPVWLDYGGSATLASYGVTLIPGAPTPDRCRAMQADLLDRLPAAHLAFYTAMPTTFETGDYFLVHAGVRPGLPLQEQSAEDLLWIREEFLSDRRHHGAMIVHGHSITPEPDIHPNRIGLDTGAYCTGTLTCLIAEDDRQWLLQADGRGIRRTALPPR